jgi:chromosomal replication initiation ATPase DnaA
MLNYPAIAQSLSIPDLEQRLKAKSRSPRIVDIRRALAALLTEQGYSSSEIAREFHRHHTSILYFRRSHNDLLATDAAYHALVQHLSQALTIPTPQNNTRM